jgi:hypothetical protein
MNAPNLDMFLTLTSPDNQGPAHITPPVDTPSLPELARLQREPLNDLQHSLMVAVAQLPLSADEATVRAQIERLRAGEMVPIERIESLVAHLGGDLLGGDVLRENARHFIKQRLNQLFGSL